MLINDNDTLRKYVPNTLKTVAGELSLFDKIQYHLLQAEQWLTATFVSSDTMSRIRSYSDSTPLLHYCRIITAAEAMLHAVPQLDLILTPNGFGIVSNQNVIPASKERIERLLLSLEKQRDDALAVILTLLPNAHHWTASEQFNYFAATMFPTLVSLSINISRCSASRSMTIPRLLSVRSILPSTRMAWSPTTLSTMLPIIH